MSFCLGTDNWVIRTVMKGYSHAEAPIMYNKPTSKKQSVATESCKALVVSTCHKDSRLGLEGFRVLGFRVKVRREEGDMSYRAYMWIIVPYSLLPTSKMYVARRKVGMWISYERIAKWLVYRRGGGAGRPVKWLLKACLFIARSRFKSLIDLMHTGVSHSIMLNKFVGDLQTLILVSKNLSTYGTLSYGFIRGSHHVVHDQVAQACHCNWHTAVKLVRSEALGTPRSTRNQAVAVSSPTKPTPQLPKPGFNHPQKWDAACYKCLRV